MMTLAKLAACCLPLSLLAIPAMGQVAPAVPGSATATPWRVGFQVPQLSGSLRYALTASETTTFGYSGSGSNVSSTNLSGSLAYISQSVTHPFSAIYSGGFLAANSGQPSTFFQNLAVSQVLDTRRWNFVVADSLNYVPETPSSSLSGLAGLGDLGLAPVGVGSDTGQGILSNYATRIYNTASGSASYRLTGATSLEGSASYGIIRFVDNSAGAGGQDSDTDTVSGALNHRIDARNTISGNYVYNRFSYAGYPLAFTSQGVNFEYLRQWSRKLSMDASIGPQRTSGSTLTGSGPSINFAASFNLNYAGESTGYSASYYRSTNSGSGYSLGARTDSLRFTGNRRLGRDWQGAVFAGYARTSSLQIVTNSSFGSHSLIAGTEASRSLTRTLFVYASYTAQRQTLQGFSDTVTPFSGLSQTLGVGLTYSPAAMHLGHR